jgi:hypothetical protein
LKEEKFEKSTTSFIEPKKQEERCINQTNSRYGKWIENKHKQAKKSKSLLEQASPFPHDLKTRKHHMAI